MFSSGPFFENTQEQFVRRDLVCLKFLYNNSFLFAAEQQPIWIIENIEFLGLMHMQFYFHGWLQKKSPFMRQSACEKRVKKGCDPWNKVILEMGFRQGVWVVGPKILWHSAVSVSVSQLAESKVSHRTPISQSCSTCLYQSLAKPHFWLSHSSRPSIYIFCKSLQKSSESSSIFPWTPKSITNPMFWDNMCVFI